MLNRDQIFTSRYAVIREKRIEITESRLYTRNPQITATKAHKKRKKKESNNARTNVLKWLYSKWKEFIPRGDLIPLLVASRSFRKEFMCSENKQTFFYWSGLHLKGRLSFWTQICISVRCIKIKRKVQEVSQSQVAANPWHQEKEEKDTNKHKPTCAKQTGARKAHRPAVSYQSEVITMLSLPQAR